MKEILCRSKTEKGNWVKGYYFYSEKENKHYILGESKDYGLQKFEVIPETVGQYTGLCDKNGTKIFEGDILKGVFYGFPFPVEDYKFKVFWDGLEAGFKASYFSNNECEILGNIHDNPELLEK